MWRIKWRFLKRATFGAINQRNMPSRTLLIGFLLCWSIGQLHAQWSKQDSVWLQGILSGKDTVRLNPEFQRAIESGTLLNTDEPVGKPRMAAAKELPITKDFSEYVHKEDTTRRKVALKDLPPGVFWRHNPPFKRMVPVYRSILEEMRRDLPAGGGAALATFDLGEMTSRKAHVRRRNAKRDATWRNYNNLPTPDVLFKRKVAARQIAERQRADSLRMGLLADSLRISK